MNTSTHSTRIPNVLARQRRSLVVDRLALFGITALTMMNIISLL